MTRQEFIDDVVNLSDLIDFCNDEGLSFCEDIYDDYVRDEVINDRLADWAENTSWRDLRNLLNDLEREDGYDYYRRNYDDEWCGLTNSDFDALKDEVIEYMDNTRSWDDDPEPEPEDEDEWFPQDESESEGVNNNEFEPEDDDVDDIVFDDDTIVELMSA